MKRISLFSAFCTLLYTLFVCMPTPLSAQSEVGVGAQVTQETGLQHGGRYLIQSQANGTPYITDTGTYYSVPNAGNKPTEASVFYFYSNGDGSWRLKNMYTGKYWGVPVYDSAITPVPEAEAGAWKMNFGSGGWAYPAAPDANGINRGLDRSNQRLWGYTTGTGNTKKVRIYEVEAALSSQPLPELDGKIVDVAAEAASDLTTGQWYVMFDRGYTNSNPHGYLYEQTASHKLYNTATAPSGRTLTAARYLVRLQDANEGRYYIQNGLGNYFGKFQKSTAVAMTAEAAEPITVAKIAGTDGHFYLQSYSTGIILDANSLENGDATVVGWGTTAPTSIGGNNDWAFYPVALEDIGPEVALFEEHVQVTRGYQTCGRGNSDALLLRIDLSPFKDINTATLRLSLNATTAANISALSLYETTATEFLANIPAAPIAVTTDIANTAALTINNVSQGAHHYWLCATVKDNATLGAILTANLTAVDYTTTKDVLLDVSAIGNPSRQGAKVFDQQHFVFRPTSDDCRYYRIPAMILDQNGQLVVAIDKRYNSNSDLGSHKIDVISMRSEDGGRTWTDKAAVATGDGYTAAYYGYGDAALARATNGDLVCIMASGSKTWGYGMVTAGYARSTDNGQTWTLVKNLLDSPAFYDENNSDGSLSVTNIFTSSGKGLTTNDGVIMFTTNCKNSLGTVCYILYSTDNGSHWRLSNAVAYSGCDESKLEQRNDGSLLLSVRQSGNRGWNTATYTKNTDGTVTFNWGTQYRTGDIWGNACNADILYYSRRSDTTPDIMLHSFINTSGRESLQLNMSLDGGATWKSVYNIQPNGSCYSTMIKLPNGNVAILFEDESYSAGNGYAINFVTITRDQILEWYVQNGGLLPDDARFEPASEASRLLMPRPHQLTESDEAFALNRDVALTDPTNSTLLASLFTTDAAAAATVTVNIVSDATLGTFDYILAGFDNEGYKLNVTANAITITAASKTGVIRAAQTLMQLSAATDGASIPGVDITDYPAFKVRGFMHDVGRSFISFDELKKEIDLLSRFKVNVFHWHLTDNQGFRFESKVYPQLNQAANMTRFAGSYYTQAQCTELEAFAAERGIIIIPEIDMPGHSTAFTNAMGFTMSSDQGKAALKTLLNELAAAFPLAPYIHMGADEAGTTAAFVNEMSQYIKETLGRRCIVWNPISGVTINTTNLPYIDMTEMWSTNGKKIAGLPNIDCRYNYINHFDVFADLVGIYKSNIYYAQRGNAEVAGAITAIWNDRKTLSETDIISQNGLYAHALATAERGWMGGGKQYIETGGTTLPNSGSEFEAFADWERRFLHYKDTWLAGEPIPYVKQTNVKWRITQAFPNGGSASAVFPPETATDDILPDQFTYEGQTYTTSMATGAGIYLRHVWGTTVPAFYSNPQLNTTAYAWTYVYSPVAQAAGALIEFQNYSRSENDKAPDAGKWDRKGSRIWVNDAEVAPPTWVNSGKSINSEVDLANENFPARTPISIDLHAGWNKVFLKLPYVNASNIRLNKWMFTFVLTDPTGHHALEGITYSPTQTLDTDHIITIEENSNAPTVDVPFIYNLAGQKVNRTSMPRGIYIIGNKKIIIK